MRAVRFFGFSYTETMRTLVCGGRFYSDRETVVKVLDGMQVSLLIHGGCSGADTLAKEWAESRGIQHQSFPANWTLYGNSAGPIRNQQMLDEGKPDVVVAFPGNKGTADMVKRARKARVRVTFAECPPSLFTPE